MFDVMGAIKGISGLFTSVSKTIDNLHTSEEERLTLRNELAGLESQVIEKITELATKTMEMQSANITAEAQSESWLTRTWRPMVMLSFAGIVVYQIVAAPLLNLPALSSNIDMIPKEVWTLLTVGIGGYVGGRSVEKIFGRSVK